MNLRRPKTRFAIAGVISGALLLAGIGSWVWVGVGPESLGWVGMSCVAYFIFLRSMIEWAEEFGWPR